MITITLVATIVGGGAYLASKLHARWTGQPELELWQFATESEDHCPYPE